MMADRFRCRSCGAALDVVRTAYGVRAACFDCDIRWTWIRGESSWVAERR